MGARVGNAEHLFGEYQIASRIYQDPCREYEPIVEREARVRAWNGIDLMTDIYRPAIDERSIPGRFPVLLCRTPYGKEVHPMRVFFIARHFGCGLRHSLRLF